MASSKLTVPILLNWNDIQSHMEQHDVVEVVRCKDCKYRNWETNGCNRNPCVEPWLEDDYCSYGKKVTE